MKPRWFVCESYQWNFWDANIIIIRTNICKKHWNTDFYWLSVGITKVRQWWYAIYECYRKFIYCQIYRALLILWIYCFCHIYTKIVFHCRRSKMIIFVLRSEEKDDLKIQYFACLEEAKIFQKDIWMWRLNIG